MTRSLAFLFAAACAAMLFGPLESAHAQRPSARVRAMNQEAMQHYHDLEFEEAERILNEARELAERRGVSGAALATTYMNLGVIAIGANSNMGRGLAFFRQAIEADPEVALDPMTSTPDMERMFELARREAGGADAGATVLPHTPASEQLIHTPLPVFVDPADLEAVAGKLYYRSGESGDFADVPMERVADGFGALVPCDALMGSAIYYYVELYGGSGDTVGVVGSAAEPVRVSVVSARMSAAPALPGAAPPEQCAGEITCDDGESCMATGGSCESDDDCGDGRSCEGDVCVAYDDSADSSPGRGFFRVGIGAGLGLVRPGLPADRSVPFHPVDRPEGGGDGVYAAPFLQRLSGSGEFTDEELEALNLEYIQTYWSGYVESSDTSYEFGATSARTGTSSGTLNSGSGCSAGAGNYCARLESPGWSSTLSLNLGGGYWVTDRLAVSGHARMSILSGSGVLARFLLSARAALLLTDPESDGFYSMVNLGLGLGRIQLKVDQGRVGISSDLARAIGTNDSSIAVRDSWANTGIASAQLGLPTGYMVTDSVGILATPTIYLMTPDQSIIMELAIGADIRF